MGKEQMIWVSMDGGGTKTELCACNLQGEKIYSQFFGRANYKTAGIEEVSETLSDAIRNMLQSLECQMDDIAGMVLAIAGCDTCQDVKIYTEIMLAAGIPEEKILICNDTEVVFRALSDINGICVVAGTGSIACAYDKQGMCARIGGWGAPLSDMGSGYWIGAEILKRMIRWLDGMQEEESTVYQDIARQFSKPGVELSWILADLSVTEVASVSAFVFSHAEKGDELCRNIIRLAAWLLVDQIVSLYQKAKLTSHFSVVTVGGLFSDDLFRDLVEAGVRQILKSEDIVFMRPIDSPAEDGLKYARKVFPKIKKNFSGELSVST